MAHHHPQPPHHNQHSQKAQDVHQFHQALFIVQLHQFHTIILKEFHEILKFLHSITHHQPPHHQEALLVQIQPHQPQPTTIKSIYFLGSSTISRLYPVSVFFKTCPVSHLFSGLNQVFGPASKVSHLYKDI